MKILSRNETETWCRTHDIALDNRLRPLRPLNAERFPIPVDTGQRIATVRANLASFENETETLVWFTEWGAWPSSERMHIFERFRLSYGEKRLLIDAPGHLYEHSEFEDLLSYVTLGVLFLWDVFVVTPGLTKIVFYSHDEIGYRTV